MTLKSNLLYSILLVLSTYLVPLIVFPYISRILGASGIGAIDSVDFFMNYAVLCSMMGISTYGIREIARSRNDINVMGRVFSELFTWNCISVGVVICISALLITFIPSFSCNSKLYAIGLVKVIANLFWIEWFFKGIEEFRYITFRSIAVRMVFVVCVFLFIHQSSDIYVYYGLWVGIVVVNAIFNWIHKKRFVRFSWHQLQLRRHTTPIFSLGVYALLCAIYTQLNVVYLDIVSDSEQVGYYTTGTRLFFVILALFSTMTSVMIPRISNLLEEQRIDEVRHLGRMGFLLLCWFSFPIIAFMEFFAHDIITLFAGDGFSGAVIPMRIIMPMVFVVGAEQILIQQMLIPLRKDRIVLRNAAIGALTCIIVNVAVTSTWHSIGAACAWGAAELVVLIFSLRAVRSSLRLSPPWKEMLSVALWLLLPCLIVDGLICVFVASVPWRLSLAVIASFILAFLYEEFFLRWHWFHSISKKLDLIKAKQS